MPLKIIRDDIASVKADAIVNSANHKPVIGAGVDSRIHKEAGKELLEARKAIGVIPYGEAGITPAFKLKADYVIHTVSPVYEGEHSAELLKECYRSSLALAKEYRCKSVAFPVLASGNNGFPKGTALQAAITEAGNFLLENDMTVYLVVFDKESYSLSEKLFADVTAYIDDNLTEETLEEEYTYNCITSSVRGNRKSAYPLSSCHFDASVCSKRAARSLDDLMDEMDETFSECLLRLIIQKGMKYPDVYKRANVDRKLFSKIKNNPEYQPKKTTATAFAIALKLSLDETKDLLSKAGYALSHSNKFDIIIEYFIKEENYDIFEINEVLFAFDQNLLM